MVSRETSPQELIEKYRDLLMKWNRRIPLVSRKDSEGAFARLCTQSVEAEKYLPRNISCLIDIGSGGGLPGIPLSILRPEMHVHLIERSSNKCLFLQTAAIHLNLKNLNVVNDSWSLEHLHQRRPLAITSLGVGEYEDLSAAIWAELKTDDGILLFISESLCKRIARDVSCETPEWYPLKESKRTGVAWLQKK